jgi:hypothetical protein
LEQQHITCGTFPYLFSSSSLTPGRSVRGPEKINTTEQNSTAVIALKAGPVQAYVAGATILALVFTWLFRCVEVFAWVRNLWEFSRFILDFLGTVAGKLGGCCLLCCPRRRKPGGRWEELVGSEAFYDQDERIRHDVALKKAWSLWNLLGRQIRRSQIPLTWQQWNQFQGRLRTHGWHRDRVARETLQVHRTSDQRLRRGWAHE